MHIQVLASGNDLAIEKKYTELLETTPGISIAPLNPHLSTLDAALFLLSPNFFLNSACRHQSMELLRQRQDLVKKGWIFAILIKEILTEIPGDGAVRLLYSGKVPRSETQRLSALREMLAILTANQ